MKKVIASFVIFISVLSVQSQIVQETSGGISKRLQAEIEKTKDPQLGYVPKYRLKQAYDLRKAFIQQRNATARAPLLAWTERGPNSDAVGPSVMLSVN
jgi:hypothetical protein